jgi:aspartate-semialdehyde dehydrogenase
VSAADRIPVAVLGATGSVGQRFVVLLERHPWFRIAELAASSRSAGREYADAVTWVQAGSIPSEVAGMTVAETTTPLESRLVFSALDAAVAGLAEAAFAEAGHFVVSNARNHRMEPDVPLLVPEVNPGHLGLLAGQARGGGKIVTNPNCSTIGLVLALAPLVAAFGVRTVQVTTLQAISGAGLPGIAGLAITENVIPFISGEEEKLERETLKILGRLTADGIEPAGTVVSAHCNRVPVVDGHTECVSVRLERPASLGELRSAWEDFSAEPQRLGLPSAPASPIVYLDGEDVPQPRLHRDLGRGMAIGVGRLRPCPVLDYKFVTVSHNTVRGAAGGAILCAELAVAKGLVEGVTVPA